MSEEKIKNYKAMLEEINCNLCGSNDYEVIYPGMYDSANIDEINKVFRSSGDDILIDQLVQCRKCGLQYLNPRLQQNLIINGYSSVEDPVFVSQIAARERTFDKYLKIIEKIVPKKGRILDVGTAGGSFLGAAKKRGWEAVGCEPSKWLSKWGKDHYGVEIHSGTIFSMKNEDNYYDVVTLWDVLEHTTDPKAVLQECNRVLKPDGLLIVNYPDIKSSIAQLMGRKWVFLLSVHIYYFTPDTIKKILNISGFEMIESRKYWQTLELGYILFRMQPYINWVSKPGTWIVNSLNIQNVQIPYWMGQVMVIAKRKSL